MVKEESLVELINVFGTSPILIRPRLKAIDECYGILRRTGLVSNAREK